MGCGSGLNIHSIYSDLDIIYYGYDCYEKIIIHHQNNNLTSNNFNFVFVFVDIHFRETN